MSVDKIMFLLQMQRFSNYTPVLKSTLVKEKISDVQNDYVE